MSQPQEKITLDFRNKAAKMVINVVDFIDHDHVVVYAPSLKLSAYGETKEGALKMLFEDVLIDFFQNLFELTESEISNELSKYQWERGKILKKRFTNSAYIDNEGILKNFNLPSETHISQNTMKPKVTLAA